MNNAGVESVPGDGRDKAFETGAQTPHISDEAFTRMLAIHVNGTFYYSRAALGPMMEAQRGSIVNLSSIAGLAGMGAVHYSTAKGAILGFTRSLAREQGRFGIRVNAIAPGGRRRPPGETDPALGQLAGGGTPEYIENIAAAVVYLASDLSTWVSGHTLVVDDGGTSTHASARS